MSTYHTKWCDKWNRGPTVPFITPFGVVCTLPDFYSDIYTITTISTV